MQHITRRITINRPRSEVYDGWRDLDNLPRVIPQLRRVTPQGGGVSQWEVAGPAAVTLVWTAEITRDEPDVILAWRARDGATVHNEGEVRFADAPAGRGTELRVDLRYEPPGGAVGKALASWFGEDPDATVREALRRYKQVLETGEVVRSDASPQGAGQGATAQPPARPAAAVAS